MAVAGDGGRAELIMGPRGHVLDGNPLWGLSDEVT